MATRPKDPEPITEERRLPPSKPRNGFSGAAQ